eukprot:gene2692-3430_t
MPCSCEAAGRAGPGALASALAAALRRGGARTGLGTCRGLLRAVAERGTCFQFLKGGGASSDLGWE